MFTIKAVMALVVLFLKSTTANNILLPKNPPDSCLLTTVLSKLIKNDKTLVINWSNSIDKVVMNDVSKVSTYNVKSILTDCHVETSNHKETTTSKPGTDLISGSKMADIADGYRRILSVDNLKSRCTITAAVRSYEPCFRLGFTNGLEVNLVKEFTNWLHFDVEIEAVEAGELREEKYDLIIGPSDDFQKTWTQSVGYHFDDLTWCVKKADLIQPWRSFFLIATWQVWTIAAIGFYVTAVTLFFFYGHYHHPENFHYCSGLALFCLFSIPIPYNPTHGIARIHFGLMLIYGMLSVIMINCYLTSKMTKPQFQYQIHTVNDLMNYEYTILVDMKTVSLHHLGNDKVSMYTKANYKLCNDTVHCLDQLFNSAKVAAIVPRKSAQRFEAMSEFPIFCFVNYEAFNRVTRTLYLRQSNSYLLNKFNFFVRQAMETGHLLKWERICLARKTNEADHLDGPVVLTVAHISGGLVIYAISAMLALLCFIGERLAFKSVGKGSNGVGKVFDKFVFSTERLVCRSKLQVSDDDVSQVIVFAD